LYDTKYDKPQRASIYLTLLAILIVKSNVSGDREIIASQTANVVLALESLTL
jgi:hypothetical protein